MTTNSRKKALRVSRHRQRSAAKRKLNNQRSAEASRKSTVRALASDFMETIAELIRFRESFRSKVLIGIDTILNKNKPIDADLTEYRTNIETKFQEFCTKLDGNVKLLEEYKAIAGNVDRLIFLSEHINEVVDTQNALLEIGTLVDKLRTALVARESTTQLNTNDPTKVEFVTDAEVIEPEQQPVTESTSVTEIDTTAATTA